VTYHYNSLLDLVALTPADRLCQFVAVPDASSDFVSEIRDRCENASRQEVPLDLRESEVKQVQPKRVRGRGMNPHVGKLDQRRPDGVYILWVDRLSAVTSISSFRPASHDVAQEFGEGGAGVRGHGLGDHFARLGIERGKQQPRASASAQSRAARHGRARVATRDQGVLGPEWPSSSLASESPARIAYPPLR
jgi:hypothetical protein